jgi:hypothetical protein
MLIRFKDNYLLMLSAPHIPKYRTLGCVGCLSSVWCICKGMSLAASCWLTQVPSDPWWTGYHRPTPGCSQRSMLEHHRRLRRKLGWYGFSEWYHPDGVPSSWPFRMMAHLDLSSVVRTIWIQIRNNHFQMWAQNYKMKSRNARDMLVLEKSPCQEACTPSSQSGHTGKMIWASWGPHHPGLRRGLTIGSRTRGRSDKSGVWGCIGHGNRRNAVNNVHLGTLDTKSLHM